MRGARRARTNATRHEREAVNKAYTKTKMCKFFAVGSCKFGPDCTFAHAEEELNPMPCMYRTKLCIHWSMTGVCSNQSCKFAHSEEELRLPEVPLASEEQASEAAPTESEPPPKIVVNPKAVEAIRTASQMSRKGEEFIKLVESNAFGGDGDVSNAELYSALSELCHELARASSEVKQHVVYSTKDPPVPEILSTQGEGLADILDQLRIYLDSMRRQWDGDVSTICSDFSRGVSDLPSDFGFSRNATECTDFLSPFDFRRNLTERSDLL